MTLNKTLAYALVCLEELGRHAGEYLETKDIAGRRGIPEAYCQKVLYRLAKAGLVRSVKGHGFILARPAETITILSAVSALENGGSVEKPLPQEDYAGEDILSRLERLVEARLKEVTLEDVISEESFRRDKP